MQSKLIRKITIGTDYKNSMRYTVGQEVFGGFTIHSILEDTYFYSIYVRKDKEVYLWKEFNKNMAISIECVTDF